MLYCSPINCSTVSGQRPAALWQLNNLFIRYDLQKKSNQSEKGMASMDSMNRGGQSSTIGYQLSRYKAPGGN